MFETEEVVIFVVGRGPSGDPEAASFVLWCADLFAILSPLGRLVTLVATDHYEALYVGLSIEHYSCGTR